MSVRWLIGSVGCGLAGGEREGDADDDSRYHLMPRERQFYDAAAEDEEGEREGRERGKEREWSGENGRREKLLTDGEGGRGRADSDRQTKAGMHSPPVCLLPQFPHSTHTCSDWANRAFVSSRSLTPLFHSAWERAERASNRSAF